MKKILTLNVLFLYVSISAFAQYSMRNAHSHNDYEQKTPFYLAYNNQFGSIEADIWAVGGELFVAHYRSQITPERTIESLYLLPIVKLFRSNGGKAWKESSSNFQLLIDLKTEVEPTLSLLVEKLKKYPDVFDPGVNRNAVCITITGNRPKPEEFKNYPIFICFDGNIDKKYDSDQLKRVALYSENLGNYTKWKGVETIPEMEANRLKQMIDSVHSIGKRIRFWNAPDTSAAWKVLMDLKVDFINTDHIPELSTFLITNKN